VLFQGHNCATSPSPYLLLQLSDDAAALLKGRQDVLQLVWHSQNTEHREVRSEASINYKHINKESGSGISKRSVYLYLPLYLSTSLPLYLSTSLPLYLSLSHTHTHLLLTLE
jgi:hypothetical protein